MGIIALENIIDAIGAQRVARNLPYLTAIQARVLGTLMEKARTVPDSYPASDGSVIHQRISNLEQEVAALREIVKNLLGDLGMSPPLQ